MPNPVPLLGRLAQPELAQPLPPDHVLACPPSELANSATDWSSLAKTSARLVPHRTDIPCLRRAPPRLHPSRPYRRAKPTHVPTRRRRHVTPRRPGLASVSPTPTIPANPGQPSPRPASPLSADVPRRVPSSASRSSTDYSFACRFASRSAPTNQTGASPGHDTPDIPRSSRGIAIPTRYRLTSAQLGGARPRHCHN